MLKAHFTHGKIDIPLRLSLRKLLYRIEVIVDIPHLVTVEFIQASSLTGDDGTLRYGHFLLHNSEPLIQVATLQPWSGLVDTVVHEITHYEQYRDGKDWSSERGRKVRIRSILKKLGSLYQ